MVAEISEAMSEVNGEDFVRHHPWDPLEADKTLEEVKKYFPEEEIRNVNVSLQLNYVVFNSTTYVLSVIVLNVLITDQIHQIKYSTF